MINTIYVTESRMKGTRDEDWEPIDTCTDRQMAETNLKIRNECNADFERRIVEFVRSPNNGNG